MEDKSGLWPGWMGPHGCWGDGCCRDGCWRNAQGRRRHPQPDPALPYSSSSCRGWVYVLSVTSRLGVGGCAAHAHRITQIPVKVELNFALPAAVEALCSEDGVVRVRKDGLERDLEVEELLESPVLSPTPAAPPPVGLGPPKNTPGNPVRCSLLPGAIWRIRLCPGRPRGPDCSNFWQPPAISPPLLVK